ncbi:MAG: DMT family transporter [Pirellulales bacterium]|nr:DMT family transporter [Pirellulales bacterium]
MNLLSRPLNASPWTPARWGMICCALSAVNYTAANVCLRKLTALDCDPTWVVCNKELVTVLVIGPWLLWWFARGLLRLPPGRDLGIIFVTGLFVQLVGNLGVQWSLGVVGLAVTIPVCYGLMLLGGAALGWWFLREGVSLRAAGAMGLLLVALILLGAGAKASSPPADESAAALPGAWRAIGAVAAAGTAGVIFAVLAIVIRHTLRRTTPTSVLMVLITGAGVITLGPFCLLREGGQIVRTTTPEQWAWIAGAGIFNLLGFLCLTKGLQLTPVVHANVLNASQVAMAAVAGILFFREAFPLSLTAGVILTIVGILLIDRPKTASETVDAAV